MRDIDSVSKVIIRNGDRILMLSKSDSKEWELPGGHLNYGEKFKKAAKREVFEETGIKLPKMKILLKQPKFVMFVVNMRPKTIRLSDEHTDYTWVNSSELLRLKVTNATRLNIRTILNTIN